MRNQSLRNATLAALFAALTGVVAQIRFFLPGVPNVPVTLQVLAVLLTGGLLGHTWGATAMLLYLLLGAVGLPVFSGGTGGIGVILGPTGGYLISFPVAAWLVGVLAPARVAPPFWRSALAMLAGLAVIYAGGAGWALLVGGYGLAAVVSGWILPFVPLDLVKTAVAAALSTAVNQALAAQGYWAEKSS
ncbi:MAG TPA: biotin transporter BioY [Symbiobacteriaceae bacterium]